MKFIAEPEKVERQYLHFQLEQLSYQRHIHIVGVYNFDL